MGNDVLAQAEPTVLQTASKQALTCTAACSATRFGTHSAQAESNRPGAGRA
jgi:hypothetical protein